MDFSDSNCSSCSFLPFKTNSSKGRDCCFHLNFMRGKLACERDLRKKWHLIIHRSKSIKVIKSEICKLCNFCAED